MMSTTACLGVGGGGGGVQFVGEAGMFVPLLTIEGPFPHGVHCIATFPCSHSQIANFGVSIAMSCVQPACWLPPLRLQGLGRKSAGLFVQEGSFATPNVVQP